MSTHNILEASLEDAREILDLQKLAYQSEAAIWNDYSIPPLTQTLEEVCAQFRDHIFLKAIDENGRIIGSVRASHDTETCYIGKLIVHPDAQNRGLGTKIMQAIEKKFQDVQRFELFTGTKSERNLYVYQKLGYRIFKQKKLSETVELVYLEKFIKE
jgi:N-acetylglutamate synthase-like GNAT family acetyltransferase